MVVLEIIAGSNYCSNVTLSRRGMKCDARSDYCATGSNDPSRIIVCYPTYYSLFHITRVPLTISWRITKERVTLKVFYKALLPGKVVQIGFVVVDHGCQQIGIAQCEVITPASVLE